MLPGIPTLHKALHLALTGKIHYRLPLMIAEALQSKHPSSSMPCQLEVLAFGSAVVLQA